MIVEMSRKLCFQICGSFKLFSGWPLLSAKSLLHFRGCKILLMSLLHKKTDIAKFDWNQF